jgi:hypothetical protein
MSIKRKIYGACLCIYAIGIVLRIALDRHWHSVSPHAIDAASGHTYPLSGHGGTVFVTPVEGHLLECLYILPWFFLLAGMLVWAQAWREWK